LTNNDLIRAFLPLIKTALTSYGYDVDILQAYQPVETGVKTKDSVYFFEVSTERIGQPNRISKWDTVQGKTINTDYQIIGITYQISVLVRSPKTYTASDILSDLSIYMQSSEFIAELESQGIGILAIKQMRANWFKDDRDQHQEAPSFDFTITYNRAIIRPEQTISTIEYKINGV